MLEGVSTTAIPSAGQTSARADMAVEPLIGSASAGSPGAGRGVGALRADSLVSSSSRASASATSPTIESPIGARAASPGSQVICTSEAPGGQQRAGDVGVVGEDGGADHEDQVVAGQRFGGGADRGRQDADEVRMVLGEPDPPSARSGGRPDGEVLALGQSDRVIPAARRIDVRSGDQDRVRGR